MNGDLTNNGVGNPTISCNATVDNAGKIGKCYVCSSGNYISFTNPITTSTTDFAISCWIYVTEYTSGYSNVFSSRTATSGKGLALWIQSGSIRFDDGEMWTVSNTFTLNTWTHICVTYSKTNGKSIYVNGNLVGSKATVGTLANLRSELFIGYDHYGYYLGGKVNDLCVWEGSTPSPKEVEIIARGLVLHYPLSLPMPNLLPHTTPSYGLGYMNSYGSGTVAVDSTELFCGNSTIRIQPSSSNTSSGGTNYYNSDSVKLTSGIKYCYSCWIKSTVDDTFTTGSLGHFQTVTSSAVHNRTVHFEGMEIPANKWTQVYIVFTPTADCSFRSFFIYFANTSQKIWVSKVKLEQGDHPTSYCPNINDIEYSSMGFNDTIEYDVSGYKYNGTKIGSPTYSSDTPRYSTSTSFNGVDDCIQVPLNTFFPNAGSFTINLWFKKHEIGSKNYETVFGGISGFEMDTRNGGNTTLSYYVTGNNRGFTIQSPLNFDTWYMLTMVCDGTNELYYLNGEYKKQFEKKGMPTGNYFIGAWRDSVSQNFKGLISDFRVYATALSATQVAELYNTSASIANNGTLMAYELVEQ